jgi:hypothetical protein
VGWYRRTLPVGAADKGRAVWLEFDGVFRNAVVIVNGYIAHENASGYAPFRVDIADFLNYDGKPNLLVVRVDASLGEGWFTRARDLSPCPAGFGRAMPYAAMGRLRAGRTARARRIHSGFHRCR